MTMTMYPATNMKLSVVPVQPGGIHRHSTTHCRVVYCTQIVSTGQLTILHSNGTGKALAAKVAVGDQNLGVPRNTMPGRPSLKIIS